MSSFNRHRLSELLTRALGGRLMSEYAVHSGVSLTYVSELIRQERANPPQPRTLRKLGEAAFGGITYEALMIAAGHLPEEEESGTILGIGKIHSTANGRLVPIMGSVRCGPGGIAFNEPQGEVAVDRDAEDLFALYCKGDSMTGLGIHEGDIAIIRQQSELKNGDLAVVVVDGEEGTLKKFHKKNDVIILEAANPSYPVRIIAGLDLEGFHIVGKVIETRKKW